MLGLFGFHQNQNQYHQHNHLIKRKERRRDQTVDGDGELVRSLAEPVDGTTSGDGSDEEIRDGPGDQEMATQQSALIVLDSSRLSTFLLEGRLGDDVRVGERCVTER